MKIPLIFLGTGQAIPTARRNHTAMLLQYKSETILVDCGEGTQRQFRKADINPCNITKILITHWHGDHVFGLPGLLQTLALNNYQRTLHIYIPKGTSRFIELMFNLFIFKGKLKYEIHECDSGTIFEDKDFKIIAERMSHGTPALAYSFVEKEKLRIDKAKLQKLKIKGAIIAELSKGKDIIWNKKKIKAKDITYQVPQKKITFILDTVLVPECEKIAKDSDLLVCESTYREEETDLAKEYKHLTATQAAQIAKKSKSKKLFLTHLSQRYEGREKLILQEARKIFKNTEIAEDLTKVEI